jgi:hypothetical protein
MLELNENYNKYFKIEEFVPRSVFKQYGINSLFFLDPRTINLAIAYREFFNKPVVINNPPPPIKDTSSVKPVVKPNAPFVHSPNEAHYVVLVLNKVDPVFSNEAKQHVTHCCC